MIPFLVIQFIAAGLITFFKLASCCVSRSVTADYFATLNVQQKLRATIVSHLCHSLKRFSLNRFRVQYRIIVCHRTLSSLKESERVKQSVVYLVKNSTQKKNLMQCERRIACYRKIIIMNKF